MMTDRPLITYHRPSDWMMQLLLLLLLSNVSFVSDARPYLSPPVVFVTDDAAHLSQLQQPTKQNTDGSRLVMKSI
jgi:hypothetical protein